MLFDFAAKWKSICLGFVENALAEDLLLLLERFEQRPRADLPEILEEQIPTIVYFFYMRARIFFAQRC